MQRDSNHHGDLLRPPIPAGDHDAARQLDEDRVEALRPVDEAPFSYVAILFCFLPPRFLTMTIVGFMLKSA
jgi:hypothetical protein